MDHPELHDQRQQNFLFRRLKITQTKISQVPPCPKENV